MSTFLPGTEVTFRGLRWEVVYSQPGGTDLELYRLRCLDAGLRGTEMDVVHPFEPLEPVTTEMDPARPGRLDTWRVYHQAFLLEQALGPDTLVAVQPGRLRIAPYQLVPVMRALRMSRVRLMLADGVGLGKTVEAGLVLAELIARRRANRILVVSPAGPLLHQWRDEMRDRFGLRFTVLDADGLQRIRRENELGANPFDHVALGLISIDFAKQERVLVELERTQYDVVVIDEAHHCTSLGDAGDREDSQRRRLSEVLARQGDGLLLLTATPHDGFDPHFASLVELLDPSLVDGRGVLRGEAFKKHMVRRLKSHIPDPITGKPFLEREVHPEKVAFGRDSHPRFTAFQEALLALVVPNLRRALRNRRYGEVLAFLALLKRSVSTAAACRNTLVAITDRLDGLAERGAEDRDARAQRLRTLREYRRRAERFGALSVEEEQDQAILEAEDIASELAESGAEDLLKRLGIEERESRRDTERLKRLDALRTGLRELASLAADAVAEDPKPAAVLDQVRAIRAGEPGANVLVYTEYADSQTELVEALKQAVARGDLAGDVLSISGADDDASRIAAFTRFRAGDGLVLVSTDASSEGLNLHQRCHHLIHLELPYNPNRLEQRNGRIDRVGQTQVPHVTYLFLAGTFEERLLLRLVSKYERQRKKLTFVPNTLGVWASDASAARLLDGIAKEEGDLFGPRETVLEFGSGHEEDTASPAYRDLVAEVERAFKDYDQAAKSHAWLGEAGVHADETQRAEAERARDRGSRLADVDLFAFVCDAVRAESRDPKAVVQTAPDVWTLRLDANWTFGLSEPSGNDPLPGFDPGSRTLRLTTAEGMEQDADGRPVGFLGRAHPIVRRSLDRVRNLRYGSGGADVDVRSAAARGDRTHPELLLTFLGSVETGAGREYERVFAARVGPDAAGVEILAEPEAWCPLADPGRAVPAAGAWDRLFRPWAGEARARAFDGARQAMEPWACAFLDRHAADLADERKALDAWLRSRTELVCGSPQAPQVGLFDSATSAPRPRWREGGTDRERLASFATDRDNPVAARREAEGVLGLYDCRDVDLRQRAIVKEVAVAPVGLLMLVPDAEVGHGA